mgnify:CR=1 FL=1
MPRSITLPPIDSVRSDGLVRGGWWHDDPGTNRIICDLCPRECSLKPGDRLRYIIDDQGVRIEKNVLPAEDDPFATFSEWSSEADDEAYGDL